MIKGAKSVWRLSGDYHRIDFFAAALWRAVNLGLPPSLPFSRDETAFRLLLTDPRHAGQNETKSIRCFGHLGILNLLFYQYIAEIIFG